MSSQLAHLGLQYEFYGAVDGGQLTDVDVARFCNQKWAKRHIGRTLLKGEIGCALSHLGVYKKIVDENLPMALVLEDDACLLPDIKPVLQALENALQPSLPRIVLLSGAAELSDRFMLKTGDYSFGPVTSAVYLAHAYVLTFESAKRMLEALSPVVQVADDWGWISRHTGIDLFACHPAMAFQACQDQSASTITQNVEVCGKNLSVSWKSLKWWKYKLYTKFWKTVDHVGLGYFFWRKI